MSFDAIVFQTFAPFIKWPIGAFALPLVAAIAWALYATLETLNHARITCSGECNIRVDLLLIYPALWILSIAGVMGLFMGRRRRGAA